MSDDKSGRSVPADVRNRWVRQRILAFAVLERGNRLTRLRVGLVTQCGSRSNVLTSPNASECVTCVIAGPSIWR